MNIRPPALPKGFRSVSLRARTVNATTHNIFPLTVHSSGHYCIDATGSPFWFWGDAPWSLLAQLTNAQIDQYLDSVRKWNLNSLLLEAPVWRYTNQTPDYNNVDGNSPFTTMSPHFDWLLNSSYWTRCDYIVNSCKSRGIFVWMHVAYMGFTGGSQGCMTEITAATGAALQTYGTTLANRFTQGNVGWVMLGDYDGGGSTGRAKQWNIVTGIRSVRTTDLICAHPGRTQDAYALVGPGGDNLTGFNVNTTYVSTDGSDAYILGGTAYGRSGFPYLQIEGGYYGDNATSAQARRCSWQTILSGSCGVMVGNKIWGFGCGIDGQETGGATTSLSTNLDGTPYQETAIIYRLLKDYKLHLGVPKTDASMVSSSLGTGIARVCPLMSSDGTFGVIYSPSVNVTVVMTNFTQGTVRVRSMDPTTGVFTSVGSFANTGSQTITVATEQVLVFD